jgi:hypothetical protein
MRPTDGEVAHAARPKSAPGREDLPVRLQPRRHQPHVGQRSATVAERAVDRAVRVEPGEAGAPGEDLPVALDERLGGVRARRTERRRDDHAVSVEGPVEAPVEVVARHRDVEASRVRPARGDQLPVRLNSEIEDDPG